MTCDIRKCVYFRINFIYSLKLLYFLCLRQQCKVGNTSINVLFLLVWSNGCPDPSHHPIDEVLLSNSALNILFFNLVVQAFFYFIVCGDESFTIIGLKLQGNVLPFGLNKEVLAFKTPLGIFFIGNLFSKDPLLFLSALVPPSFIFLQQYVTRDKFVNMWKYSL